jgi:thioredoxin reductase (NADPH)
MIQIDLAIIGAGPAGLSAAIYGARGGLTTVLFEKGLIGGQIVLTTEIENYPGFEDIMSGFELMEKMRLQAVKFGTEIKEENVEEIRVNGLFKIIKTDENTYQAKTLIYAAGASPRKLDVPGEEQFTGRGVSYCATCDGALYRNKTVAVIGGGDSAIEEAMFLTKFASKVYIIHRRDELRAVHAVQQRAFKNEKLEFILDTIVETINGDTQIRSLSLLNKKTNEKRVLDIDGIFIYVGIIPNSELIKPWVELDTAGFAITDDDMQTKVPGLYVVGDVRQKTLRQVVTATSDGAIAGFNAEKWIGEL